MSADAPTDHAGLVVMGVAEADALLASQSVGRIAFVADGEVVILPINYRMHEGTIVFRTSEGAKLEAGARHASVAFEIDGWDVESQTGWSVLVKGTAVEVLTDDEANALFDLGLRPWAAATEKRRWVRVRPDEITGRKIV
ncbi:MAG: pyridoxamine 5'-phosphate oxidase family protein [Acidimicrobiia bacterium]|nr:pyridoxamine 5'-phosphate oxidase family protein [Acidimicrobiia bacterium]MDH5294030.1 pyridoxamine 5'-phosphate oxidase family protein [Acidimicrobiia bacterium]MDH5522221.1 pyridoxamine 5'-phosphate oxidase family protein [Acidimicrobiia bacterium]